MVANSTNVKQLVKILMGAAWIDGVIQPQERQYVRKIAQEQGLESDPEIKPWLYELVTIKPAECYEWIKEYLGDSPTNEDYQNLLQAISGLIYSDGEVATEEAKFLAKLQRLSNGNKSNETGFNAILKQIQKLYRNWIDTHC